MNHSRRKALQTLAAALALGALPACAREGSKTPPQAAPDKPDNAAAPKLALNDGNRIPLIGYGTWDVRGAEGQKAIETALELGYRHIDTAVIYENEDIVGAAVRASGIPRDEIFITSKIWSDMNREGARRTVARSLKALGLDYIDLYLLHRPEGDIYGAWEGLIGEQRAGRVKSIGVSNFNAAQITEFDRRAAVKPVLNQIELNPAQQQQATRRAMQPLNIAVQAHSPFGGAARGPGAGVILKRPELLAIAEKHGKSAAQIVLRWLVQQNIIAIPKSANPSRMKENLAVFDFSLDNEDMRQIAALDGK